MQFVASGDGKLISLRCRGISLLLPVSQCPDAGREVAFVVVEVVRPVVSRWFANVIEIIGLRWIERCLKRTLTRRGNRPRRQTGMQARVVRRTTFDVTLVNLAVVSPLSFQLGSVDDG